MELSQESKKNSQKRGTNHDFYLQEIGDILNRGVELLQSNEMNKKSIHETERYLRVKYGKLKKNSELIEAGTEEYKVE